MIDSLLVHFSPEVIVTFLAALPFGELRLAVPMGVSVLGLSALEAFIYAYVGNMVPVFGLLFILPRIMHLVEEYLPKLYGAYEKQLHKLERKHGDSYEKYGRYALMILVAIPLPGSGVYAASLLSVLFDIPWRSSLISIMIGLLFADLLVILLTTGVRGLLSLIGV